jgi:hypothetical protein
MPKNPSAPTDCAIDQENKVVLAHTFSYHRYCLQKSLQVDNLSYTVIFFIEIIRLIIYMCLSRLLTGSRNFILDGLNNDIKQVIQLAAAFH